MELVKLVGSVALSRYKEILSQGKQCPLHVALSTFKAGFVRICMDLYLYGFGTSAFEVSEMEKYVL